MKKNRYGQARVLDSNQLDLLIDYLPSNFHKTLATCLRRSGARVSEVCKLKWENLEKDFLLFPSRICIFLNDFGGWAPYETKLKAYLFIVCNAKEINVLDRIHKKYFLNL